MITIEQLNAVKKEYEPKVAMRHGHGHFVDAGDGIRKDVLICGGRSKTFGQWQSWVFAAGANGVMTGNYLTTKGCAFCDDAEIYEVLGLREERS